jgi:hypothetical protein
MEMRYLYENLSMGVATPGGSCVRRTPTGKDGHHGERRPDRDRCGAHHGATHPRAITAKHPDRAPASPGGSTPPTPRALCLNTAS